MEKSIAEIKQEINTQIQDKGTFETLLQVTFKGLTPELAKRAMLEGMMRGMTLQDFLVKNIYAIPFNNRKTGETSYSLINSIDYCRKVGMRSGVCGKSAPIFEEKDGKIISCTITIKRKVQDFIGEYSATAFFTEYNTGLQQWASKPRTMIAKVAEMHALRMACPEELSQAYIEEEYEQDVVKGEIIKENQQKQIDDNKTKLENCKTLEELKTVWASLPAQSKNELTNLKEELKTKLC